MFVNILISILYFAIHVTGLTLNPNVFITWFHSETHLSSNLTGCRFIDWFTTDCITRPTIRIAIFRWTWSSGATYLLITLKNRINHYFLESPRTSHRWNYVVLRFLSDFKWNQIRKWEKSKTEINSLRSSLISNCLTGLHLKSQKYWYSRPGSRFCRQWRIPFSGVGGAEHLPP